MKQGETYRWDLQADAFGGQYKAIRRIKGNLWEVEHLPADEETQQRILDHWALAEAGGWMTCPIWDRTWAECDEAKGERPQRIGALTYEQELERDLARYADQAGSRMELRLVSRADYDRNF